MRVHRSQHSQKPSKVLKKEVKRVRHLEIQQWALYPNASTLRGRISLSNKTTAHSKFLRHKFK